MLAEKHDIDQLFRDRLEDFDVNPPMYVWKNIEDALDKRRKAHMLALMKGLSIAAAVVLAFVAGWWFTQPHEEQLTKEVVVVPQHDSNVQQQQLNTGVKVTSSQITKEVVPVKMAARVAMVQPAKAINQPNSGNGNTVQINQSAISAIAGREKNETLSALNARLPEVAANDHSTLSDKNESWLQLLSKYLSSDGNDGTHLTISEQDLNDRRMIAANIIEYAQKNKPEKRWNLAAEATPLFSGSAASSANRGEYVYASNAVESVSPSHTSTEATLSGGLMFGYKLNKRLSVKSGIVYSKIRHNTNQVPVVSSYNSAALTASGAADYGVNSNSTAYSANTNVGMVNFRKPPESIKDGTYLAFAQDGKFNGAYTSNADLKQDMEYIEVPVLVSYHLINRKVNVDLNGGVSTNILVGNSASLYESGMKTQNGETSQLRDLVYAGTVGLGLGYELSKRVTVSLEPRMKYYLNSISTNSHINYRPYQLGIYTGVTYAFN